MKLMMSNWKVGLTRELLAHVLHKLETPAAAPTALL